ncbi:hemerythrin domain-containing protein [Plantactinospora sp. WMMC1484]|uniref:hemerythrin domain-containing protein n=1 Tax=Plantactinospora sp. WMMC1484 TaxID=3404122 RepID=UPI003BF57D51
MVFPNVAGRPDTDGMLLVHRIFRRESGLLPRLVRAVPDGDVARAEEIARHYLWYAEILRLHHDIEDELIWPLLLARLDLEAELVLEMEEQHRRIDETLVRIAALLPPWRHTAATVFGERLAEGLDEHRALLLAHLDGEEHLVLDLIADYLTVPEWDAAADRARTGMARRSATIALGALLEEATAGQRRWLFDELPVAARLAWRTVGHCRYARHVSRLRAPLAG